VDTLESDLASLQDESGGSALESDVQDAKQMVSDICDGLTFPMGNQPFETRFGSPAPVM
jgi:hypothetical protein